MILPKSVQTNLWKKRDFCAEHQAPQYNQRKIVAGNRPINLRQGGRGYNRKSVLNVENKATRQAIEDD
jgi:hypothetical protein